MRACIDTLYHTLTCLQLRIELGKFGATFRLKQSQVDEQIADVSGQLVREGGRKSGFL